MPQCLMYRSPNFNVERLLLRHFDKTRARAKIGRVARWATVGALRVLTKCSLRGLELNSPRFIQTRHRRNFRYGTALGFFLALGILAAYPSQQKDIVQHEEDLSIAGFILQTTSSPELQTMLKLLPSNRVVPRIHGGEIRFVYADPDVCHCLYIGSQRAYNLYKQIRLKQHRAPQGQITVHM